MWWIETRLLRQYVVGYAWSFAIANYMWHFLYGYVGALTTPLLGLSLFTIVTLLGLVPASLLALSTPDRSFYDMHGHATKSGLAQMTFWCVDLQKMAPWLEGGGSVTASVLALAGYCLTWHAPG